MEHIFQHWDTILHTLNGFIMGAIFWIVYNLHVGNYAPLIGNFFEIVSGTVAVIRFRKKTIIKK